MTKKLFALVFASSVESGTEVFGGAPFDAETLEEAEKEIVDTYFEYKGKKSPRKFLTQFGFKVVPMRPELDAAYKAQPQEQLF